LERGWRLEAIDLSQRSAERGESVQEGRSRLWYDEPKAQPPSDLTLMDLEKCQAWLYQFWDPTEAGGAWGALKSLRESYLAIIQRLNSVSEQFNLDDRKVVKLFKVVLACAMYRCALERIKKDEQRKGEVDERFLEHCHPRLDDVYSVLRHAWERPGQRDVAQDNVLQQVKAEDSARGEALGEDCRLSVRLRV